MREKKDGQPYGGRGAATEAAVGTWQPPAGGASVRTARADANATTAAGPMATQCTASRAAAPQQARPHGSRTPERHQQGNGQQRPPRDPSRAAADTEDATPRARRATIAAVLRVREVVQKGTDGQPDRSAPARQMARRPGPVVRGWRRSNLLVAGLRGSGPEICRNLDDDASRVHVLADAPGLQHPN